MRQRGANVTDIVVLVVAADDGVMPQTLEAIKHAKSANVPIIVAINKVDKPDANPDRAKQDLARHEVQIEDFGGDTQVVCVSGKTGKGMDELEESIITLSEILDNRAPVDGPVEGWLLESSIKTYGRVGTVLVRRGVMRPGNIIVAGRTWARIKTLRNEAGALVEEIGPGMPAEVDGWKGPPTPGDEVLQANDEQNAAAVVRGREAIAESLKLAQDMKAINESRRLQREVAVDEVENEDGQREKRVLGSFQENKTASGIQEVPFIVKADVIGSVEAVVNLISGLGNGDVRPHIIRSGAGAVTEGDIELAAAANGCILAFNTDLEPSMQGGSAFEGVRILRQSVIYRVAEDVNRVLEDAMPYFVTQRVTGEAEIAQTFSVTLPGKVQLLVAGCKVRNGLVTKGSKVKVMRGGETVHDGRLALALWVLLVIVN
jgi:translation initiation factor IF-2